MPSILLIAPSLDFPVLLEYVVTLAKCELGTEIHATNHSNTDVLQFQTPFHNYVCVPANDVKISLLTGKNYFNKTEATPEARATPKLEQRKDVNGQKFTNSVYKDVVWNPQETTSKAIGDTEDGGWCV